MSEEWEWDNRDEIEHIPRWVELLLVIVGFPIVMVSVVVIIFPTLNLTNGLILSLVIAFVVYIIKDGFAKGEVVNRQIIRVKDRVITYKINDEGRSHVLINVVADSLTIDRNAYPHKLEWLDGGASRPVHIPLIGMSLNTEKRLYGFLDRVIVYQEESAITSGE
ncbi:MAG: hypothetical protein JAY74_02145 [Candidatus Thiodiazotropha taylori]|nr:hypothetical protein [Candidatus Thiodiazotropha taylori]RLW56016.1 MAG: hypothetical protein B6D76_01655 [gamma proteobacterium symbiont of Stewartia floridana]RLW56852.1 MAG: hypothetical protein B6D75_19605 [gamma proteobacterium symbiont of Stewartia floridana]